MRRARGRRSSPTTAILPRSEYRKVMARLIFDPRGNERRRSALVGRHLGDAWQRAVTFDDRGRIADQIHSNVREGRKFPRWPPRAIRFGVESFDDWRREPRPSTIQRRSILWPATNQRIHLPTIRRSNLNAHFQVAGQPCQSRESRTPASRLRATEWCLGSIDSSKLERNVNRAICAIEAANLTPVGAAPTSTNARAAPVRGVVGLSARMHLGGARMPSASASVDIRRVRGKLVVPEVVGRTPSRRWMSKSTVLSGRPGGETRTCWAARFTRQ